MVSGSYDPLFVTRADNRSQYVESQQMVDQIVFRDRDGLHTRCDLDGEAEPFRMDVPSHH